MATTLDDTGALPRCAIPSLTVVRVQSAFAETWHSGTSGKTTWYLRGRLRAALIDAQVLVQKIEVSFRKSIPLRQTYFVEGKIEKEEDRKFQVSGQLFARPVPLQGKELSWADWNDGQRTVYATIVGTLAKVPLDKVGELRTRAKF